MANTVQVWKATRCWLFWAALAVSCAGLFPIPDIIHASGGSLPVALRLEKPLSYVILSPLSATLDALTFLSVRQHVALACSMVLALVAVRLWRRPKSVWGEFVFWCKFACALTSAYAACVFLARPSARLQSSNGDHVVVDFHSHTRHSHDGSSLFSPERSREWHRDLGFHAAYLTDHGTLVGAREGMRKNPRKAGDGTVLLPGMEVSCYRQNLVLVGTPDEIDCRAPGGDYPSVREFIRGLSSGGAAFCFLSLPSYSRKSWGEVPSFLQAGAGGLEIVKADPVSLDFPPEHRRYVVEAARQNDLPLVAVTDNHGYGKATPAWTVLEIANWRDMAPEDLDRSIRARLKTGGFLGTVPVVRPVVWPADGFRWFGIAVVFPVQVLRGLDWAERFWWVFWAAVAWGVARRKRAFKGGVR